MVARGHSRSPGRCDFARLKLLQLGDMLGACFFFFLCVCVCFFWRGGWSCSVLFIIIIYSYYYHDYFIIILLLFFIILLLFYYCFIIFFLGGGVCVCVSVRVGGGCGPLKPTNPARPMTNLSPETLDPKALNPKP